MLLVSGEGLLHACISSSYFILMIYLIVVRSQQIFSSAKNCEELNANLNNDLHNVSQRLVKNKLHHHSTKTKLMYVESNHVLAKIDHEFPVMINDQAIPRVQSISCLGQGLNLMKH